MADKPGKDLLADDDEPAAGAEAGEAGTAAAVDGVDFEFAADAFDAGDATDGAAAAGDGAAAGEVAGDGAAAGDDDDDTLSAGGDDDDGVAVGDDDGAGVEDDEDIKEYSTKVRKRIQRERTIARRAREEVESERTLRITAQKQSYELNKNMVDVLHSTVLNEIKAKVLQLKAAKEEADTSREVDLQQELNELTARKSDLESARTKLATPPDFEGASRPNEMAANWKDKNRWYGNPKFKAESALLENLDRQLAKTGRYSPRSPEYFRELDRMVAAEMPDLRPKVKSVFRPVQKQQPARVAAVQTRGATPVRTQASGKGKTLLGKSDVANMIAFKMDPKNPEHVKQYAREKQESSNA